MRLSEEDMNKLAVAEDITGYCFKNKDLLLSAITHPSAAEDNPELYSYERLEFLGDSVIGFIVADIAFDTYYDIDEGGLTRIKVALVEGTTLAEIASDLGFADIIVFGSSETGTGNRGLHSALENVYEAVVAAMYLDGGLEVARDFIKRTLIPRMSRELSKEPENPKSVLQEKLQEGGITPTYKLVDMQGPPHDRTFVAQVFAGDRSLGQGTGRTKKEAESQAAKSSLVRLGEFFGIGKDEKSREDKEMKALEAKRLKAAAKAEREAAAKQAKAQREEAARQAKAAKAADKIAKKAEREAAKKKQE